MAQTQQLQVGPHSLESLWVGPPHAAGGTALVFLHEGLGSVGLWRDFPARLSAGCGLPGFVYSRSGYGQSSSVPLPRLPGYLEEEARLLPHVLQAAGIGDCVLVGHSDGASIALAFASELGLAAEKGNTLFPVRLRGLLLEAPHVFTEEVSIRSIARMRDAWNETDLPARLGRWHKDAKAAFWGWCGPWLDPAFRRMNLTAGLRGIEAPVLLVQGKDDEYGTTAQLDAIRSGVRGPVETLLLDDCGHSPHRDQAEAVLEAMAAFVRRCV
jgi:pimeloyl-ACP methyl ester carboxylesterase